MQPPPRPGDPIGRAAGSIALALLALAYHGDALSGWWLWDDPQLVLHAMSTSPLQVLFSPSEYLYLAAHTFTPLLTLSFDVDLALAGASPRAFYLHQIIAIAIAAVLLYLLLYRFTDSLFAWIGAAIFVVGPPTLLAARTLMIRHYVEGLVLALAAFLLWTRRKEGSDLGAAALYLTAMLAKEIYAPLPLLMLYQAAASGERLPRLARRTIPLASAAVVFLLWRGWMLGSWGGFGELAGGRGMLRLPVEIWDEIAGALSPWSSAALFVAALAVAFLTRRPLRSLAFIATGVVACAIPLVAVAGRFEPRYAFATFVVFVASLALAARRSILPGVTLPLAVALIFFGIYAGSRGRAMEFADETEAMLAEGRYIWQGSPQGRALLASSSPEWYLAGVRDLRAIAGRGAAPRFFLSIQPLVLGEWPPRAVFLGRPYTGALAPLDHGSLSLVETERRAYDPSVAITAEISRRDHALHWSLGPDGGAFELVTYPGYARVPVPAAGWRRIPDAREQQYVRVRRTLPDGRWNISAVLPLPREGERTSLP